MLRQKATYVIDTSQVSDLKIQMLDWLVQFSICIYFDSNSYSSKYSGYECLCAAGAVNIISGSEGDLLAQLQKEHDNTRDWFIGHINYDYKQILFPKLSSGNELSTSFPALSFFVPETVCYINREQNTFTIESVTNPDIIYRQIQESRLVIQPLPSLKFSAATNKTDYINVVSKLRQHIADGDCYEINYCTRGYCKNTHIVPVDVFKALNKLSPAPFSAYYQLNDKFMMCASPERYLKKEADIIYSQPIKGTARRDSDLQKDEVIKKELYSNIKERAENVMIVDLVRNDLARTCEVGSVTVDELFGIYSFPQVHQMISTVSGKLKPEVPFTDVIRHSFPMGSMTGAPKYKVMQLIEHYEQSARELFSGSVGYITPEGDFDFNVVIRSLFYNASTRLLSYQTGGAITFDSEPEAEWNEMRLKAWALERIFS